MSPQFGKNPGRAEKAGYSGSVNFENGKFRNLTPSPMDLNYWKLIQEYARPAPNRNPGRNIEVQKIDPGSIQNLNAGITRLTWFGHSAFLLEMDGKKILIDPMFGNAPAPLPLLGPKRYSRELPIEIENLPAIDAVILSHDHYDHLDYGSIQKLKGKVDRYFTPLGVGSHLAAWGVPKEKIHELNWWEESGFEGIRLVCTPARHFSGRGLFDRSSTLWSSWVISGKDRNIFFSGDSGYDIHFAEIGEKYGPFDISLMECGQYHEDWKLLHMMPEETAQAAVDLKSRLLMPIHWGAFTLALHDWADPAERVTRKANELNMPVTTPKIGEPVQLGEDAFPVEKWWTAYMAK